MPQDFSSQKLYGRSFVGQDLQHANFEQVKTGRNLFMSLIFYIGSFIFSISSGAFLGVGAYLIGYILTLFSGVLWFGENSSKSNINIENSSYIFLIIVFVNIILFHFFSSSIEAI